MAIFLESHDLTDVRFAASFLAGPANFTEESRVAREDGNHEGARSQDTCQRCGSSSDLIPDRDIADLFLCKRCTDEIGRQQQFIDWGFGEAPDDLG